MKGGSGKLPPLRKQTVIEGNRVVDQVPSAALDTYHSRLCRKETKTGHCGHIGACPQLLATGLQVRVLLPDAAPQVFNFGVGRAVVAGMAIAITVRADLFVQPFELIKESTNWAGAIACQFFCLLFLDFFVELPRHSL